MLPNKTKLKRVASKHTVNNHHSVISWHSTLPSLSAFVCNWLFPYQSLIKEDCNDASSSAATIFDSIGTFSFQNRLVTEDNGLLR